MSYKTDRLIALLPEIFAVESESLLYHLLDAVGAEFLEADESIKKLLRSHWVNYAEGAALDALASIYSVSRRRLRDGSLENDDAFRRRLKSVVELFTGGGSVKAVKGAVRSALGLPFDLSELHLQKKFQGLRDDIEALVVLEEFKLQFNTVTADSPKSLDDFNRAVLQVSVDSASTSAAYPDIEWRFTSGSARHLRLEVSGTTDGFQTRNAFITLAEPFSPLETTFIAPEKATLRLSADKDGNLMAVMNNQDVTGYFVNLSGAKTPLRMPLVPQGHTDWTFRAGSGFWDESVFDVGLFDAVDSFGASDADGPDGIAPQFDIRLNLGQATPLEFTVKVPYFLKQAVEQLADLHGYPSNQLLAFEGLPPERIQEVVDQTRAAGVRGTVQFTLNLYDKHALDERLLMGGTQHTQEDAGGREGLFAIGSVEKSTESHDAGEHFLIGSVFDRTTFDGSYGFAL